MNTTTNKTAAAPSSLKRIILASANRRQLHSTGRQKRALKTLRKMGRFDDNEMLEQRRLSSAEEAMDD